MTCMYFFNKHILINYLQILYIVLEKCKLCEPTKPKHTKHVVPNIIHVNLSHTKVEPRDHNAYLCIFVEKCYSQTRYHHFSI